MTYIFQCHTYDIGKSLCHIGIAIYLSQVVVWCSGNELVLINAVALHRARLVLGWVGTFG